ncbi:MAG: methyltransferase [Bacteriovoracaceae bacterium]|nr:methyltransferase [Bacteriovoracaceae bacterium]
MKNNIHNRERILSLIGSYRITQALALGASLRLFDKLKTPKSLKTISLELGLDSAYLKRLLDLFIELQLLIKVRSRYMITKSGAWLCSDTEGSLKDFAKLMGADWYWEPWGKIEESMRKGKSAFLLYHGKSAFKFMEDRVDAANLFHSAMNSATEKIPNMIKKILKKKKWDGLAVADLGGGTGSLGIQFALQAPGVNTFILDLIHAKESARREISKNNLNSRVSFIACDFFKPLPKKYDLIILRHILHDWSDQLALKILKNAKKSLTPNGHIVVIERVLERRPNLAVLLMDIEMMAMMEGGHERSIRSFSNLFKKLNLKVRRKKWPEINRDMFLLTAK